MKSKRYLLVAVSAALLLHGCKIPFIKKEISLESFRTTYSPEWETVSSDDGTDAPVAAPADSNKIPVSIQDGNREFLFADSIRQENGVITALVEYRYAAPQVLPETGRSYTHNHWLEQIDCNNHIRSIRSTTHYNEANEIVDANEYAVPRYSAEDIKMLAKPEDGVIREVCRRVRGDAAASEPAAASAVTAASQAAASEPVAASQPTAPVSASEPAAAPAAPVAEQPAEASAPAAASAAPVKEKKEKNDSKQKKKGKKTPKQADKAAETAPVAASAPPPTVEPAEPAAASEIILRPL